MRLLSLFLALHFLAGNICPIQMAMPIHMAMEGTESEVNELVQNSTMDCAMECFSSPNNGNKDSSSVSSSPTKLKGFAVRSFQPFLLTRLSYIYIEAPPGPQSDQSSLKKIIGTTVLRI